MKAIPENFKTGDKLNINYGFICMFENMIIIWDDNENVADSYELDIVIHNWTRGKIDMLKAIECDKCKGSCKLYSLNDPDNSPFECTECGGMGYIKLEIEEKSLVDICYFEIMDFLQSHRINVMSSQEREEEYKSILS